MDAEQSIWYENLLMRRCLISFSGVMLIAGTVQAEPSWPQFRGPNGDGTSKAKHVPVTWSESNNVAWKAALPGRGRSSPVVLKDRIWLTTALERGVKRVPIAGDDMQT